MADKPVTEVVAVDAVLDALVSPTSSDVYEALGPFSNDAVAAVAAKRAAGGGGGAVSVTDGGTTVDPATTIQFSGATVADGGGGIADVTVPATPNLDEVLSQNNDANGHDITGVANLSGDGSGSFDTGGGDVATSGGDVGTTGGDVLTGSAGRVETGSVESGAWQLNIGASNRFIGFFGRGGADASTELPALVTAQDIADFLVSIGLVTQAS